MNILWCILCIAFAAYAQGRVLILTPPSKGFLEASAAIQANISDMQLKRVDLTEHMTSADLKQSINAFNPNLIVLMDNKSIRLYKQYLSDFPTALNRPIVALMALQIENALSGIPQAIGISYEIPAVTTVNRLRGLLQEPIRKVGVIYRSSMESFFQDHMRLCKVEHIELIGVRIGDEQNPGYELKKGLNSLVKEQGVEAIWILNDNLLLTPKLIQDTWLPFLKNGSIPAIVGVEPLVQTKVHFGTFAVLPDPAGLGAQAANLIYDIQEENWQIPKKHIDQPLSIIQILNLTMAKKVGTLRPEAAKQVDKALE